MSNFVDQVVDFNQKVLKIEQREVNMLSMHEFQLSMKCLRSSNGRRFRISALWVTNSIALPSDPSGGRANDM